MSWNYKYATHLSATNPTVTLERELHFVYPGLNKKNLIFTKDDDLYIIDFDYANFLPISFMHHALAFPSIVSMQVADQIRHAFDNLPSSNFEAMANASSLMAMSSAAFCRCRQPPANVHACLSSAPLTKN